MTTPIWKRHTVDFAWPTVMLAAAVGVGHLAVWGAVLSGHVSMGWGFVLQTLVAYLAFTVAHEAAHGNVHGKRTDWKWLNGALGWLGGVILFAPFPAFKVLHLQHHAHVNHGEDDPDHWVASSNPVGVVARCFTIMPYYYFTLLVGPSSRTNAGARVRRISMMTLVTFLAVGGVFAVFGLWLEVLALWIGPAIVASGILAFAFDWLPHHPHDGKERYHDTRIILGPGLPLATMWQSYHLVHHLYPRVPFYRYGTCFHELRPELEERGADIVQPFTR